MEEAMKLITIFLAIIVFSFSAQADKPAPSLAIFRSYMATIKNSFGAKIYRNRYYNETDGRIVDVLGNGNLSCAYYVSSVLRHFKLVDDIYLSVADTAEAMKKSGWKNISEPVPGSVIIWDKMFFKKSKTWHMHIGFYLGRGRAMSNSSHYKYPAIHNWRRVGGYRKIKEILWNGKLNQ
jgi:uncharacterized membrane protein YecN with MAPEG domain